MRPILYAGVIFSLSIALGVLSGYVAHPFRQAQAEVELEPVVEPVKDALNVEVQEEVSTITLSTGEVRTFYAVNGDVWASTPDGAVLVVAGADAPEVVAVDGGFLMRVTVDGALVEYFSTDGMTFALR